jgi:uncharacterized membrane protein HdeD (DUF308 family)
MGTASLATNPFSLVKLGSTWSIVLGVLFVVAGIFAIAEPFLAAVVFSAFLAWLLILVGVMHIVAAFQGHTGTSIAWKVLIGSAYVIFGIYGLMRPGIFAASLTLLLGILFLVEGVFSAILWWKTRSAQGATWILIDALVTLALGGMIYYHWPSSTVWAIGTLVGVGLIMSGTSRIMMSLAARRIAGTVTEMRRAA